MFTLQVPVVYIRSKLWLHFCPVPIVLRMRRAKQPSKQLNSESIRGAALCYMSPVVAGQCSIICAKCVFNVKEKDLSISWNDICKKRDLCDREISGSTQLLCFSLETKLHYLEKNLIEFPQVYQTRHSSLVP